MRTELSRLWSEAPFPQGCVVAYSTNSGLPCLTSCVTSRQWNLDFFIFDTDPEARQLLRVTQGEWGCHIYALFLSLFLLLSGVQYNWSGYHRPSSNPQTPMVMPSPVYQPWDYGMSASSGQLHGNPSLIMSSQDSLVPRWDAWNATYPLPVQHVLLASLSGDNNFQLPWSPRDESSSPQWRHVGTFLFPLKTTKNLPALYGSSMFLSYCKGNVKSNKWF